MKSREYLGKMEQLDSYAPMVSDTNEFRNRFVHVI